MRIVRIQFHFFEIRSPISMSEHLDNEIEKKKKH